MAVGQTLCNRVVRIAKREKRKKKKKKRKEIKVDFKPPWPIGLVDWLRWGRAGNKVPLGASSIWDDMGQIRSGCIGS
jgi:hypothetical protein